MRISIKDQIELIREEIRKERTKEVSLRAEERVVDGADPKPIENRPMTSFKGGPPFRMSGRHIPHGSYKRSFRCLKDRPCRLDRVESAERTGGGDQDSRHDRASRIAGSIQDRQGPDGGHNHDDTERH